MRFRIAVCTLIACWSLGPPAFAQREVTDKEIQEADHAVAKDPSLRTYMHRAELMRRRGHFQRAIDDYSRAIEQAPDYAEYYRLRAEAYSRTGDHRKAIADYDVALEVTPEKGGKSGLLHGGSFLIDGSMSRGLHLARGLRYRALGEYDAALKDFAAAIRIASARDSRYYDVRRHRGSTYLIRGDYQAAASDFEEMAALLSNPDDVAEAGLLRHIARLKAGTPDGSLGEATRRVDMKVWPGAVVALFMGKATDHKEVRIQARAAYRADGDCNAAFWLAQFELSRGKTAVAKPLLAEAKSKCYVIWDEHQIAAHELKRLGN